MRKWFGVNSAIALLGICGSLGAALPCRAQLSLYTVVDLARRNSPSVHLAQADVARAKAAVDETRDAYLPSFNIGSSIGYSYGFPVGQPSIYNVEAQSLAISFSQPDYIRAARAALRTAELSLQDALDQVALDTALDYVELDTVVRELEALAQQRSYGERLGSIEQQRVSAGVESRMNATRAELGAAQADLRRLDLLGQAELLRERLAHRAGLAVRDIVPQPESIPGEPEFGGGVPLQQRMPSVDAGYDNARSRHFQARGDDRQNDRPQIAFGINYSRYAEFNNYAEYYLRFQHNNFDVGLQVQMPFLDASKRARARVSAAEAVHADVQANQARDAAEEQVVQLSGSLPELRAQQRVARLQNELAQEQLESVLTQSSLGTATPGAPALSPSEEMQARIAERQRYVEVLNSSLQLTKAELTLLRATGGIEDWVNMRPHTP